MNPSKSVSEILARATTLRKSPLETVEGIYDGQLPDIKPPVRKKLKYFVEPIRKLRQHANAVGLCKFYWLST